MGGETIGGSWPTGGGLNQWARIKREVGHTHHKNKTNFKSRLQIQSPKIRNCKCQKYREQKL